MDYEKDYWIKPDGTLLECEDSHDRTARKILEAEMGLSGMVDECDRLRVDYPYEVLHCRGWVRVKNWQELQILGGTISFVRPMRNTIDPSMNEAQLKTAKRICDALGTTLHNAINDRRFHE